ncbi:GntR family transcriptional regulator [Limnoglobus roseus]|uniref:GntR family transcriptional regulator n=1 Tax=Limnoglobus roseus TaxID=2598579 RepID=A0A5C1AEW0_9BACT|nr:GntR family transcriptional regulator [Limnoglobus roseus]QEL17959.1 GntR family transcriptional regulator [Limnoglobus roseus]
MQDTLSEKTYRELRRRVLAGELEAGSQLVNRTLAETMEVSLAPVREAIHRLATEGLVEHVPGAGAFVRKASGTDLEELYVLREAVESCAAAEAARNITQAQLDELDDVRREFEAILTTIRRQRGQSATDEMLDRWLDCEERFHRIVVEAARNRLLAKVIDDHTALGQVFGVQRHRAAILTLAVAEETCRDHAAIADAIRSRDADAAHRLMSVHIRKGRRTVSEYLRNQKRNES